MGTDTHGHSASLGAPVITFVDLEIDRDVHVAIAVGDNFSRQKMAESYRNRFTQFIFPPLIHQSSVVDPTAQIEEGCVVMPQASIGPNTQVGKFCIVNTAASIDHDCLLNSYSSLAPGVRLGGSVTVGERSAVCLGAGVRHKTVIGSDTVLGGGSYLNDHLPSGVTAYGVPAKVIRKRLPEDPYL